MRSRFTLAALLPTFSLLACASAPAPVTQAPLTTAATMEFAGAPPWVSGGCSKAIQKKGVICGVGSVKGTSNVGLARTAATARGRDEIGRSIEITTRGLYKDYAGTTAGGAVSNAGQQASEDAQQIENAIKQVTNQTLNGTYLEESWISPSGTYYALVLMDTEKFKDAIGQMKQLSEGLRAAIAKRADKAFEELDRETAPKQ